MKAPSSNLLVKVAVPVVLASAVVVGVKSCSGGGTSDGCATYRQQCCAEGSVAGRPQSAGY